MRPALSEFEKRRIMGTLPSFRKGISQAKVLRDIETATMEFCHAMETLWATRYKHLYVRENEIKITIRSYYKPKVSPKTGLLVSAGPPQKDALRAYIAALSEIYKRATGKELKRKVLTDAYVAVKESKEKHLPFLVACLKVAGVPRSRYPFWIVRAVLEARAKTTPRI